MFHFARPAAAEVDSQIVAAASLVPDHPGSLALVSGMRGPISPGFVHDISQSVLGCGDDVFAVARTAMGNWTEFDLGWVQVADANAPIAEGQVVAVIAATAGLWSVNLSRIVETIDTPREFGFLYATTRMHIEQGEERFLIEHHGATDEVTYTIEAVSRPRSMLARLGYPFARAMQHRFARESHARMAEAVHGGPGAAGESTPQ